MHRDACLVYRLKDLILTDESVQKCPCCFCPTNGDQFEIGCDLEELNELGSGFPLYFL